jgi:hypothetical protein
MVMDIAQGVSILDALFSGYIRKSAAVGPFVHCLDDRFAAARGSSPGGK